MRVSGECEHPSTLPPVSRSRWLTTSPDRKSNSCGAIRLVFLHIGVVLPVAKLIRSRILIGRGAGLDHHNPVTLFQKPRGRRLLLNGHHQPPKERYQTEVDSWRELQSKNIEFTMKRLREPIEGGGLH